MVAANWNANTAVRDTTQTGKVNGCTVHPLGHFQAYLDELPNPSGAVKTVFSRPSESLRVY